MWAVLMYLSNSGRATAGPQREDFTAGRSTNFHLAYPARVWQIRGMKKKRHVCIKCFTASCQEFYFISFTLNRMCNILCFHV